MNKIQNFLNNYSNLNKTSNSISKKIDSILMRPGTTEQQRSCLLMVDIILKSIIISRHLLKNTLLLAENYYNLLFYANFELNLHEPESVNLNEHVAFIMHKNQIFNDLDFITEVKKKNINVNSLDNVEKKSKLYSSVQKLQYNYYISYKNQLDHIHFFIYNEKGLLKQTDVYHELLNYLLDELGSIAPLTKMEPTE